MGSNTRPAICFHRDFSPPRADLSSKTQVHFKVLVNTQVCSAIVWCVGQLTLYCDMIGKYIVKRDISKIMFFFNNIGTILSRLNIRVHVVRALKQLRTPKGRLLKRIVFSPIASLFRMWTSNSFLYKQSLLIEKS